MDKLYEFDQNWVTNKEVKQICQVWNEDIPPVHISTTTYHPLTERPKDPRFPSLTKNLTLWEIIKIAIG